MDLSPGLNEPLLRFRQAAAKTLNRLDGERGGVLLVVRVEMRQTMLAASLDEHSDDDPEEPREFRHGRYINIVRLSNSIEDLMDRGEPFGLSIRALIQVGRKT